MSDQNGVLLRASTSPTGRSGCYGECSINEATLPAVTWEDKLLSASGRHQSSVWHFDDRFGVAESIELRSVQHIALDWEHAGFPRTLMMCHRSKPQIAKSGEISLTLSRSLTSAMRTVGTCDFEASRSHSMSRNETAWSLADPQDGGAREGIGNSGERPPLSDSPSRS